MKYFWASFALVMAFGSQLAFAADAPFPVLNGYGIKFDKVALVEKLADNSTAGTSVYQVIATYTYNAFCGNAPDALVVNKSTAGNAKFSYTVIAAKKPPASPVHCFAISMRTVDILLDTLDVRPSSLVVNAIQAE